MVTPQIKRQRLSLGEAMIPAQQPFEAFFTVMRNDRSLETTRPVIAWDSDGNALVADHGQGRLRAANSYDNFVRIEEARGPAVGIIPGGGWRAEFRHDDGAEIVGVLAWALDANRYGTPLWATEDGEVGDLQEASNLVRLIPPEEG